MPLRPDMRPQEFLEVFHRRKWFVIFSILLILFGASVYCVVTPEMFKSSTTILVVPQRVSENYVKSTVSSRIEDRLATIQQQVQSRTRLVAVMDELGLFKEERQYMTLEEIVAMMRKRITIEVRQHDAFTLSFLHKNREYAMRTTARLSSFFIDENLKTREQQAVGTARFLESQLQITKQKLEAQEERVRRYKTSFMGELPQQLQVNLALMSRLQDQLKSNADATRTAQDRKMFIESQISTAMSQVAANDAQGRSTSNGTEIASSEPSDPAAPFLPELNAKRAQLANLSTKYTEQYPEIRRLKWEIVQLEKRIAESRTNDPGIAQAAMSTPVIREKEEIRRLRSALTGIDLEIQSLKKEGGEIRNNMGALQIKLDQTPKREQEMISLTRDYDNLKRSYDELLRKKLDADVAQNLEKRQKDEQFQILDPANFPEEPFIPNRMKIFGIAVLGALLVGFGGAIGLEAIDPTVRTAKDFRLFSGITVLATIPNIQDHDYVKTQKMQRAAVFGGLITFTTAVTIFLLVYGSKIRMILSGSR